MSNGDDIEAALDDLSMIQLDQAQRVKLQAALLGWWDAVPKRNVPDLQDRILRMQADLTELASTSSFVVKADKTVKLVAAHGNPAKTFAIVRLGSTWFNGWHNADLELFAAVG